VGLSAVALVLVARLVSGRELLAALGGLRPGPLIVVLACIALDRVLMAAKWGILLRAQNLARPLGELVRTYFVATFYGSFLPTGVGGDVIRVFQVSRGKEEIGRVTASVVMERALGLIALAVLVSLCLGVYALTARPDLLPLLGVAVLASLAGVGGVAFALHGRLPARLARFAEAFRAYAGHRGALARFTAFSFLEHLVPVVAVYWTARALGYRVGFPAFLVIIPIDLFVTRIPISIDAVGVREGLYVSLFAQAGLGASQAFLLALVGRVVTLAGVLPGCFLRLGRTKNPA
jgi:uncharacterized membrane protein YbhN (UPF0104 family)